MRKIKLVSAIIVSMVLLLNGCATVSSLDRTRSELSDRVKSNIINGSYAEVYTAAKQACRDLKLAVYSEDERQGKIYACSSWRWLIVLISWGSFGFGEKVGIYLTELGGNSTRVEVAIQKTFLLDIGYADWRERILASIAASLKPS